MREDDLTQNLRSLLETQSNIQLAILFGSMATQTERADSDIDIAVLSDRPLSAVEKTSLIEAIADMSGRAVDLIDLRTAGEPLLGEVLQGQRLLGSNDVYASLLSRHLIDAADFGPLQQRILKERRDAWIN